MTGQGLSRERRLRRRKDFEALRERADSRAHPLLVMRALPNALPQSRFGFIISKKVSRLAVARNNKKHVTYQLSRSECIIFKCRSGLKKRNK